MLLLRNLLRTTTSARIVETFVTLFGKMETTRENSTEEEGEKNGFGLYFASEGTGLQEETGLPERRLVEILRRLHQEYISKTSWSAS